MISLLFALGAWSLFSGCESSSGGQVQKANPAMGNGGSVVVLSCADLSYLPADYSFIYSEVDQRLPQWLREQGVAVVSPAEVDAVLNANDGALLRRLKSTQKGQMESAVVELIDQLRERTDVRWVILPQVMVRSLLAQPPFQGVRWDGVNRNFVVHGGAGDSGDMQLDVASLTVGVYSPQGQAFYFGVGGIDFLDNGVRAGEGIYTAPRQPGQISASAISEAAQIALGPWLYSSGMTSPPAHAQR